MKTILTITDVTGMASPFVCVAGVNPDGKAIRLKWVRGRIDEHWLCHNGTAIVRPFNRVGFNLISASPEPPHTEDWFVDPCPVEAGNRLIPSEQARFLTSIKDRSVASIFNTEILHVPGAYIRKGQGERSLGTVRVERLLGVYYHCYEQGWDYRIRFMDAARETYSLKVKDITFCAYLDFLREENKLSCDAISRSMTEEMRDKVCYLRIGLARGWADYPDRCYLQITGVFTFPDYLGGRWLPDFRPLLMHQPGQFTYRPTSTGQGHVRETPPPYEETDDIPF